MSSIDKVVTAKIDTFVKNGKFHAEAHSYSLEIMEYSYETFIQWCIGKLVLAIGSNKFPETIELIIWAAHMWFLYQYFPAGER